MAQRYVLYCFKDLPKGIDDLEQFGAMVKLCTCNLWDMISVLWLGRVGGMLFGVKVFKFIRVIIRFPTITGFGV